LRVTCCKNTHKTQTWQPESESQEGKMNLNETEKKPIERIQEEELEERIQRFLGYTPKP